MTYNVQWSDEARADFRLVPVFRRGPVFAAIGQLRFQAEMQTRNRKPLVGPIADLPDATWEVRAGNYRAFYSIGEGRTVKVLRVILKRTSTTADAVSRGRTS